MTNDERNNAMTNEQSTRLELLARLDELDKVADYTNDPEALAYIKAQKKALREAIAKLNP